MGNRKRGKIAAEKHRNGNIPSFASIRVPSPAPFFARLYGFAVAKPSRSSWAVLPTVPVVRGIDVLHR